MKVIVGLGNPGAGYAKTRHNLGFMVVDEVASRLGKPRLKKKTTSFLREDFQYGTSDIIVIKPLLYMNLSGDALNRTGLNWVGLMRDTLVVYDESAFELGKMRLRRSGSAGGHKGMKNIIERFGTDQIPRLRVGIGKDPEMILADYVLKSFTKDEKKLLSTVISTAADAVMMAIEDGLDTAMQHFNQEPGSNDKGTD